MKNMKLETLKKADEAKQRRNNQQSKHGEYDV